ncbi:MAG: Elongation factor 1-alpha [Candidatus Heimdallarchaeota archaeon LC_3]|nr:MAG: Elongation factor 1-alpha [Candidatus Heimdallarchaeota archaeon LC_3]
MADLERVNLVITGHVDHGKSTSLGHMLFLLGQIHDPKKKREAWRIAERYFIDSRDEGMGSWSYAWILEPLMDERKRGLTINISFQEFKTQKYIYNLIDAPGHSDFVKNMITGASQADAAILVVSARKGEFEDGIATGGEAKGSKYANVIGMTMEHMLLLISLGITDIVVMINKMDTVNWDQKHFEGIRDQISKRMSLIMNHIRIENAEEKVKNMQFVPTSGLYGVNMLPKDMTIKNIDNHIKQTEAGKGNADFIASLKEEKIEIEKQWPDWYSGPSLLEALDGLPSPAKKKAALMKLSLRVPIQSSLTIPGVGNVLTGRVATGVMKTGQKVVVSPTKQTNDPVHIEVKSIEEFHKQIDQAIVSDNIGFSIKSKNVGAKDIVKGAVVSDAKDPAKVLLPNKDGFMAVVLIIRSLGKKGKEKDKSWSFHKDYAPVIHVGTAQVTCRVMEIKTLDGASTDGLSANQRGMVWFTPVQPVVIEPLAKCAPLGRFAIRDSGKTVGVGIVDKVEYSKY